MAAAYATFANDGIYNEPYYIEPIDDAEGNVLYQHAPDGRRAVTRQTARLVAEVLEANVRGGTGTRARITTQADGGQDRHRPALPRRLVRRVHARSTRRPCGWARSAARCPMYGVGGISVTGGVLPGADLRAST